MQTFLEFIRKEIYHIFRDYRTLFVLFGMPVAQLILFGFAIRTEINDADIGIIDNSKDYVTQEITNKLLSSGYFRLNGYIDDINLIENYFKAGKFKEIIIFENDFAYKLNKYGNANVQIIADASNPNVANLIISYTRSIINDYMQGAIKKTNNPSMVITPEVKMLYNPELKSVYKFVPGLVAFILMLVSALMTSITITREKEMGNMEILLVSPLKPQMIIIGKVIPYIVLSFVISVIVLGISMAVFELPFKGSLLLFMAEILLFIITALTLGIFISTISNSQQVAMMISLAGLLLPTTLLSGFIYPIENMPLPLQWLSNIIPAKWFLIIAKDIMLKGLGFEYFWKETLILISMTLFFILLSIKNFKIRLQ